MNPRFGRGLVAEVGEAVGAQPSVIIHTHRATWIVVRKSAAG